MNGDILGYFLLKQFFLHFHLNKLFQNKDSLRYFKVTEVVCV